MLKDNVVVRFIAGKGGIGVINFGPNYVPMGGDGGRGGDIYLESRRNYFDYSHLSLQKPYSAPGGTNGGKNNRTGADAEDIVVGVPPITEIYDLENNLIARLTKEGQRVRVAVGGEGGFGNHHFRSGGANTLRKASPPEPGSDATLRLVLKLVADIALIGLPNAGKSSLLNLLTKAKSKVGDYPFTTLSPHLGRLQNTKILLDLPGLIEGTASGKGLGTKFLQHTSTISAIWHCISCDSPTPLADYETIRKELELMDPRLTNLPEKILLTKSDLINESQKAKLIKLFGDIEVIFVSMADDESLENLNNVSLQ